MSDIASERFNRAFVLIYDLKDGKSFHNTNFSLEVDIHSPTSTFKSKLNPTKKDFSIYERVNGRIFYVTPDQGNMVTFSSDSQTSDAYY